MKNLKKLDAYIDGSLVGTLAIMKDGMVAFQYDSSWLKNGFAISPFDLPLRGEVFIPKNMNCRGLFGIFEDSLPDAWGTLLTDRKLGEMGIDPTQVNVLDRLSLVGDAGAGDIEYIPSASIEESDFTEKSFDEIKAAAWWSDLCRGAVSVPYGPVRCRDPYLHGRNRNKCRRFRYLYRQSGSILHCRPVLPSRGAIHSVYCSFRDLPGCC